MECRYCRKAYTIQQFAQDRSCKCPHCAESVFYDFAAKCPGCDRDTAFHLGGVLQGLSEAAVATVTESVAAFLNPFAGLKKVTRLFDSIPGGKWGICSCCLSAVIRCPSCLCVALKPQRESVTEPIRCQQCKRQFSA